VKLAVVVQRYGQAINGGAELHARYIAEHLAKHSEVDVLTTCASDYVTWKNELPAGVETVNGVSVRRFRVRRERDPLAFGRLSAHVFDAPHTLADELAWLDAEGPASPALIRHVRRHAASYDYCIFFSYRYYHAYHGIRAAAGRAILVPTAERDSAIGLSLFKPIFQGVRALMYNSPEEREMIQALAGNERVPSVVVGVGSQVPTNPQASRFRQKFKISAPFAVYVGRIDENKGCKELFDFFQTYVRETSGALTLVLIGNSVLPVPDHPRIKHLGFLDDADKFDALAGAELLIMPSYFESLSMVALEAWALGKPVLANARCDVLKGQSIRSNAGLFYDGRAEFVETLLAIEQNRWLAASLGRNGRDFFREHYDWPVVIRKYLDIIEKLKKEPLSRALEPLPGWFARRSLMCPAASQVVKALPAGPVLKFEEGAPRPAVSTPAPPPPRRAPVPERGRPPQRPFRGGSSHHRGPDRRRGGPPRRPGSR
jgi:glycosyltransferase involved in cell wall biosynthesis